MFVRMNNIEPKTQTLESDNGQQIKLGDQLTTLYGKIHTFKSMGSDSTAYIKVCNKYFY